MSSGRKYAKKKDAQHREELSHEDYDFGSKDEKGRKKDDSDDSDDSDDEKFNSTSFLSTKIFSDDEEEREDDADDGDIEDTDNLLQLLEAGLRCHVAKASPGGWVKHCPCHAGAKGRGGGQGRGGARTARG